MKKQSLCSLALIACVFGAAPAYAAEIKIYGKLHVSGDFVDAGHDHGIQGAMSSNSSSIGFAGSEMLNEWLMALWKLESDIDVTGERNWLLARNRYIGLASSTGTFFAGYQDTPFRLAAQRFDIYGETLTDYRTMFGLVPLVSNNNQNGRESLDSRARNSVMYQSPRWGSVQIRLLQSAGDSKSEDGGDANPISSVSVTFQQDKLALIAAYENQVQYESEAVRLVGSLQFGIVRLNGMYETLKSSLTSGQQRQTFGGNITIGLPANFSLHGEGVGVANSNASKLAAAMAVAGVSYQPAKSTMLYLIGSKIYNDTSSNYMFGSLGHEDQYKLEHEGQDPMAYSVGITYKF